MFSSRISYKLFFILVASLALTACDSNDDEGDPTDAERFLGNWTVVSAADQNGNRDQTQVFSSLGVMTVNLNQGNQYALLLNYTDPAEDDLALNGPYTVNETGRRLILTVSLDGLTVDLPFEYAFVDDSTVDLTVDGTVLGALLGTTLEDNVVLRIQKNS